MCENATVRFQWKGMHGVFQIPTIACPSNFTSGETDSYKFLAPVSNGGGYEWEVPGEPGHYWVTSQHSDDCRKGMVAEFFVVHGDEKPFPAAGVPGRGGWALFAILMSPLVLSLL